LESNLTQLIVFFYCNPPKSIAIVVPALGRHLHASRCGRSGLGVNDQVNGKHHDTEYVTLVMSLRWYDIVCIFSYFVLPNQLHVTCTSWAAIGIYQDSKRIYDSPQRHYEISQRNRAISWRATGLKGSHYWYRERSVCLSHDFHYRSSISVHTTQGLRTRTH